jgi:hypothetical protein
MENKLLFFLQVAPELGMEMTQLILKVFDSGLSTGILVLISWLLYKELKEEKKRNDDLTDKVITNNIMMQEQLKDIIELLKERK